MRFKSKIFWVEKDAREPEHYQDAFAEDAERGLAAIADGVTAGIFSGEWARLLTRAVVADPPRLEGEAFSEWLAERRAEWRGAIDTSRLTWFQRPKMIDGGMTTLLWIELARETAEEASIEEPTADAWASSVEDSPLVVPAEVQREFDDSLDAESSRWFDAMVADLKNAPQDATAAEHDVSGASRDSPEEFAVGSAESPAEGPSERYVERESESEIENAPPSQWRARCFAIGDSCLFHLREGRQLACFPMSHAVEFSLNPSVLRSVDRQTDHLLEFQSRDLLCREGDLLALCTDAVALWAMTRYEAGENVAWDGYWDMSDEAWREEVFGLREAGAMRYDDSTLMLLRVAPVTAEAPAAIEPAIMESTAIEPARDAAAELGEPANDSADHVTEPPSGAVELAWNTPPARDAAPARQACDSNANGRPNGPSSTVDALPADDPSQATENAP